jgi:hypothetical protein
MSAKIVFLDEILADYGPETRESRDLLRRSVVSTIHEFWPGDASEPDGPGPDETRAQVLYDTILSLKPHSDAQRSLRDEALTIAFDLGQLRDLLIMQQIKSIPAAFLIALCLLVFWFTSIFFSLGIYAPPNSTVVTILILSALSLSIAFFMIIELNRPFEGFLRMPSAPLTQSLGRIGR